MAATDGYDDPFSLGAGPKPKLDSGWGDSDSDSDCNAVRTSPYRFHSDSNPASAPVHTAAAAVCYTAPSLPQLDGYEWDGNTKPTRVFSPEPDTNPTPGGEHTDGNDNVNVAHTSPASSADVKFYITPDQEAGTISGTSMFSGAECKVAGLQNWTGEVSVKDLAEPLETETGPNSDTQPPVEENDEEKEKIEETKRKLANLFQKEDIDVRPLERTQPFVVKVPDTLPDFTAIQADFLNTAQPQTLEEMLAPGTQIPETSTRETLSEEIPSDQWIADIDETDLDSVLEDIAELLDEESVASLLL